MFGLTRSTFTTGDGPDDTPPAFGGLTTARFQRWRGDGSHRSSCWELEDGTDAVFADHAALPADVARIRIDVRRADEAEPFWTGMRPMPSIYAPTPTLTTLSSDSCWDLGAPVLEAGERYCLRLTVYDAAGNMTDGGESCEASQTCALTPDTWASPTTACVPPSTGGCTTAPGRTPPSLASLVILALLLGSSARPWRARVGPQNH